LKKLFISFAATAGLFFGGLSIASADDVNIYYGPRGGFSKINNSRVLHFSDKSTKPATLANALVHFIDGLEPGSSAKYACIR